MFHCPGENFPMLLPAPGLNGFRRDQLPFVHQIATIDIGKSSIVQDIKNQGNHSVADFVPKIVNSGK
jgi:hypothetical protein